MKVPFEWLQEFVVIDIDPQELAKRLTLRGLEVEAVESVRPTFRGVVVGQIKTIEKHPDARNLSVCVIDNGSELLNVVCGATNIKAGQKVPLAMVGGCLKGEFVIEQKKLRGTDSYGMLCSEKELDLSDDHSGIFILPDDIALGQDLSEAGWVRDTILDISIAPNRGDCLSIFGIAREVASILNQKAKLPLFKTDKTGEENVSDNLTLEIRDAGACPRYVLKMIRGTSIVTSPFWMRQRIIKCGMRPINSLVDVTNYVMLELGQPLHAFDYERLTDKRIEVRMAEHPQVFRTLDGVDRNLETGDILICDGSGPVAIAGIMGGENSEITDTTRDMALESAYFNPLYVRKTARRLGIRSEASLRFEKGTDIDNVAFAAERAIHLMQEISGGTILKGEQEFYEKKEPKMIFLKYANINGLLGTHIRQEEITRALRSIDLHVKEEDDAGLVVSVPHFRHDIEEAADVVEEISRIHGYEHIPATSPVSMVQPQKKTRKGALLDKIKEYAFASGFYEVINFAFSNEKEIAALKIPESDKRNRSVAILNPISKEYSLMRTMLAPGVLKIMAYNLNRGAKNLRFFEEGKVFFRNDQGHPSESRALCFALTGKEREYHWRDKAKEYDFFDAKGVIEGLLEGLRIDMTVAKGTEPFLHPARSADLYNAGLKIGWIGEIADDVLKVFEIEQTIYCAELDFDIILAQEHMATQYRPIPRYPQVTRDFSFHVDDSVAVATLTDAIKGLSPLITSVGVFDMFRKETRSIAFRVVFQSYEETLKEETINALQEEIINQLANTKGISLRV